MKLLVSIFIISISLFSCSEDISNDGTKVIQTNGYLPFANDTALSDKNGWKHNSTNYFPIENCIDSHWVAYDSIRKELRYFQKGGETRDEILRQINKYDSAYTITGDTTFIDSFTVEYFSYALKELKEPDLHNYYQNKSIYRLTNMPSFGKSFTISIIKEKGEFYIQTKVTEVGVSKPYNIHYNDSIYISEVTPTVIAINERKNMPKETFNKFDSLIKHSGVENLHYNHQPPPRYTHSSHYLLEVHNEKGYYFISRSSDPPIEIFDKIISEFFKLSDLEMKEELINQQYFKKFHQK